MQSRWRNLVTCFRRELNKQKMGKSGQDTSKRRKYVYFDQLLFLLPTIVDRTTVRECSPSMSMTQEENSDIEDDFDEPHTAEDQNNDFNSSSQAGSSTQKPTPTSKRQPKAKQTQSYEESLLTILKEKKEEAIDEDKSFLLSIVPSFKKLNDAQKIDVKMEFLATLKRFSQASQGSCYRRPEGQEAHHSSYYGHYGFEGNYNQNPARYFHNVQNYPSTLSTPNPLSSDTSQASRGSSFEPVSPQGNFTDLP